MSADGSVTLNWAGEERKFRLAIGQLRELQENVNRWRTSIGAPLIGPNSLVRLLVAGDAWPSDVREIIRLGLIGGGMKIDLVPALVRRYVDERPLVESTQIAQAILLVALVGVPDDPVGKKPTAGTDAETKIPASDSPPSTEPDASSATAQSRSTNSPSGNSPPASMVSSEPMNQPQSPRR